jgi:nucleotide-binding universal stress UspA family protein
LIIVENARLQMTYRRILAAISGGSASKATTDVACRLARAFDANVEGFHVKWDAAAISAMTAGMLGLSIDGIALQRLVAESETAARRAGETFRSRAEKAGLVESSGDRKVPSFAWRVAKGSAPELVAEEAILYDLVVLGRSDRVLDEPSSHAIEETLTKSGRPVLLTPSTAPADMGQHAAIGWNHSPQAARAVSASLPLLKRAEKVTVITIGKEWTASSAAIVDYLAWHGVSAHHLEHARELGRTTGARLIEQAETVGADLLVMGAFSHSPWQEALFGGASREALKASSLPILLTH